MGWATFGAAPVDFPGCEDDVEPPMRLLLEPFKLLFMPGTDWPPNTSKSVFNHLIKKSCLLSFQRFYRTMTSGSKNFPKKNYIFFPSFFQNYILFPQVPYKLGGNIYNFPPEDFKSIRLCPLFFPYSLLFPRFV